jgi:hypothetical protein
MTETDLGPEELVTIEIVGLPVDVQSQAQQQTDELARELTLVAEQLKQDGGSGELPVRFVELVSTLSGRYSVFTAEQERQLTEAIAAGERTIDLTYTLPVSAVTAAAHLGDVLDEADDYCRSGKLLLTLATPAPLVTYRKWFLAQFVEQAAGHPPVTWSDYAAQAAAR